METGLNQPNPSLQKRTLFFLMALLTSDSSDHERIERFASSVAFVGKNMLDHSDPDIREMAIQFLARLLEQNNSAVDVVVEQKEQIEKLGKQRVKHLNGLTGEEKEYATVELELWGDLLKALSKAKTNYKQ